MKLQAKTRLRAEALNNWQDSVRATYGESVKFKQVGELTRAFIGTNQVGEYKDGTATIDNGEEDVLLSDAISEPGITDMDAPTSTGVAFDTLIDGDPKTSAPIVQDLTRDDGGIAEPEEKDLLIDDLVDPTT
jgi:hypothetical protein